MISMGMEESERGIEITVIEAGLETGAIETAAETESARGVNLVSNHFRFCYATAC